MDSELLWFWLPVGFTILFNSRIFQFFLLAWQAHEYIYEHTANIYIKGIMALREDQIIALAPDASSAKSGKGLAVVSRWPLLGVSDKALWGHCQGSGKLPYQTQVDLVNTAFKCSCPSRKFPCKHGLGLMLLYSREPGAFTKEVEPKWVSDWLHKRTENAVKKTEKENKPVDTEAQAKRAEARARKVAGGMDELQVWLKDLIRNGLLTLPERAYEFWQAPARRMVDAQAPGLASMIKSFGNINYFQDSWKSEVLHQLTKLYLVSEAYKNIENLPENLAREIKNQVGFTQAKEELLNEPGIPDEWLVLARTLEEEDQLIVERNWLYGLNNQKFALILQFIVNRQLPEYSFLPGTVWQAELVFYKGAFPMRALIKEQQKVDSFRIPEGYSSVSAALKSFSEVVTQNPFSDWIPAILNGISLIATNSGYFLQDVNGEAITAKLSYDRAIKLLAISGGHPCNVFVLMNGELAEPLAVWVNYNFIPLQQ